MNKIGKRPYTIRRGRVAVATRLRRFIYVKTGSNVWRDANGELPQ